MQCSSEKNAIQQASTPLTKMQFLEGRFNLQTGCGLNFLNCCDKVKKGK